LDRPARKRLMDPPGDVEPMLNFQNGKCGKIPVNIGLKKHAKPARHSARKKKGFNRRESYFSGKWARPYSAGQPF